MLAGLNWRDIRVYEIIIPLQYHHISTKSKIMFWTLGSIYGASAVAFGAFGAHGLKKRISDPTRIAAFNTAAHYQVCFSSKLHTCCM
jgi:hypothetical protein